MLLQKETKPIRCVFRVSEETLNEDDLLKIKRCRVIRAIEVYLVERSEERGEERGEKREGRRERREQADR